MLNAAATPGAFLQALRDEAGPHYFAEGFGADGFLRIVSKTR